jgi:hypothetical protein
MASEDDRHDFVRKIQSDAFRVVEMTREQAKNVRGLACGDQDHDLDETFGVAIDEAQAEADQDTLTAIVIIKIVGAAL